jgi:hypothetical protein
VRKRFADPGATADTARRFARHAWNLELAAELEAIAREAERQIAEDAKAKDED